MWWSVGRFLCLLVGFGSCGGKSTYDALGEYLRTYDDGSFAAITILSDIPLPQEYIREFVGGIDVSGQPFSFLNFRDSDHETIMNLVSIYETFIICIVKGTKALNFIQNVNRSILVRNSWMVVPFPSDPTVAYNTSLALRPIYDSFSCMSIETKIYHFQIDEFGNGHIFEIYRIISIDKLLIKVLHKIRNYNLIYINDDYIWSRRRNLHGLHLRIGYIKDGALFGFDNEKGPFGIFYEVYKIVKQNLNITETFIESVDGYYGSNSSTGIIGMLSRNEIDMSVMDFDVTEDRAALTDFTVGLFMDYKKFYTIKAGSNHSWGTFVGVFSDKFWGAVILCDIGFIIITWLAFKVINREKTIGLGDSIATPLRSMGALGVPEMPQRAPGRILIITICLVGAMVYWCYNAGLTSLLTVDVFDVPIKSLKDLIDKPEYQILVPKGTSVENIFKDATETLNPEAKIVYEKYMKDNPDAYFTNLFQAKDKAFNNSKYVIFIPQSAFYTTFRNLTCVFASAKTSDFRANVAWATLKHFPYLPLLNFQLAQVVQTGILDKFLISYRGGRASPCSTEDFRQIGLSNIISAYVILGGGSLLAIAVVFGEKLFAVIRTRNENYIRTKLFNKKPTKRY